ncbi:Helix-turn-helix [Formivibrio citricus]|uniref:Helix-turn-helix n=1 Tax=Formivibrio citricus TaxID=83765 RepID=A0A1I4YM79_9NEIS|nr:helix-turn-helix transcriptional regulator [Formivibrio citricus]SFN39145.1 Helix-turn-helix [Formivibrio citricus]
MSEAAQLVFTIKRLLKSRGHTYRDVAQALHLSEASVKRLFSAQRLSVDRLAELSAFLGLTLAELVQETQSDQLPIRALSMEQEAELVSDERMLLVAACAINQWRLDEIQSIYALTEPECLKYLLRLERIGLIRLLPGNRIRLTIARDFAWLPNGPIQCYFRQQCQADFLAGDAIGSETGYFFVHGMLTPAAMAEMEAEVSRLRRKFAELHRECASLPLHRKYGMGFLLALREWEPESFTRLRRTDLAASKS